MHHGLTRRDLLTTFLGLPAALAAGCTRPPPLPEGRIVGASEAVGHRLRQGPPPRPDESAWQSVPVVIVGAGVAGLAAAWHLERSGTGDFVVLELEPAQVMLVAAHNDDLAAARRAGLSTAFVPRPTEHGPAQTSDLRPESDWDVVAADVIDLAHQIGRRP